MQKPEAGFYFRIVHSARQIMQHFDFTRADNPRREIWDFIVHSDPDIIVAELCALLAQV